MIATTSSRQCNHFLLSERCPPTSTNTTSLPCMVSEVTTRWCLRRSRTWLLEHQWSSTLTSWCPQSWEWSQAQQISRHAQSSTQHWWVSGFWALAVFCKPQRWPSPSTTYRWASPFPPLVAWNTQNKSRTVHTSGSSAAMADSTLSVNLGSSHFLSRQDVIRLCMENLTFWRNTLQWVKKEVCHTFTNFLVSAADSRLSPECIARTCLKNVDLPLSPVPNNKILRILPYTP